MSNDENVISYSKEYYLEEAKLSCSQDNNATLKLSSDKFYTIALCNAKQLFLGFVQTLERIDNSLTIFADKPKQIIQINKTLATNQSISTLHPQWKSKIMLEIKKFFTLRASYYRIKITPEFLSNSTNLNILHEKVLQLNKKYSALFFQKRDNLVHCFGTKVLLGEKIYILIDLIQSKNKTSIEENNSNVTVLNNKANDKLIAPLKIVIKPLSLFSVTLHACQEIFDDFEFELKSLGGQLFVENLTKEIYVVKMSAQVDESNWGKKVDSLIRDYEMTRIVDALLEIPIIFVGRRELFDLKSHMNHFFGKSNGNTLKYEFINDENCVLNVIGYAVDVNHLIENVKRKLVHLENNIRNRVKSMSMILFNEKDHKLQYQALTHFNQIYFVEIKTILEKEYDASIEKVAVKDLKAFCLKKNTETLNENSLVEWKQHLSGFLYDYFSKFCSRQITIKHAKENILDSKCIANDFVILTWLDNQNVELFGISAEVDKVESSLNKFKMDTKPRVKPNVGNKAFLVLDDECSNSNDENELDNSMKESKNFDNNVKSKKQSKANKNKAKLKQKEEEAKRIIKQTFNALDDECSKPNDQNLSDNSMKNSNNQPKSSKNQAKLDKKEQEAKIKKQAQELKAKKEEEMRQKRKEERLKKEEQQKKANEEIERLIRQAAEERKKKEQERRNRGEESESSSQDEENKQKNKFSNRKFTFNSNSRQRRATKQNFHYEFQESDEFYNDDDNFYYERLFFGGGFKGFFFNAFFGGGRSGGGGQSASVEERWKSMNFYKTLGLERNATDEQVRKAYKERALLYHPGNFNF